MSEVTDNAGNRYTSDYSIFIKAQTGISSIVINQKTQIISGSSENDYAFIDCKDTLSQVSFDEGSQLKEIKDYGFYSCSKLKSIDFSKCSSLTKIGPYAFYKCGLESVTFNEGLETISEYGFASNNLIKLHFPSTIRNIGSYSFAAVSTLTEVTYAENCGITTINTVAFESTNFKVLHIPPHLTTFSPISLWNNNKVEEIILDGGECDGFVLRNNCLYQKSSENNILVYYPKALMPNGVFQVPEGTLILEEYSFATSQLNTIILPDSLQEIQSNCFRSSTIINITIPKNVKYLNIGHFLHV